MFKHSSHDQSWLLPPSLEESVSSDHLARYIRISVESLDMSKVESGYSSLGQRAYHPKMLLSLLLYGYAIGVRSSRKLAQACEENIAFMWLSGRQTPDFRTISQFRKDQLGDMKKYFQEVLMICMDLDMARCGKISLDGTKFRANANRHKLTYRSIVQRRKERLEKLVDDIFDEAEQLDREEDALYGDGDGIHTGTPVDPTELKKKVEALQKQRRRLEKKKEEVHDDLERADEELRIIGDGRNSSGKTDPDATHLRMKEDYPAPGYNVQFATEHQVILAYDIFSNGTDHYLLPPMREEIYRMCGRYPEEILADAGYGNQKTYQYLEEQGQKYTIPYQNWRKDRGKRKKGIYTTTSDPRSWWEQKKWEVWSHLQKKENRNKMKRRGYDVEPTIGDIKENMKLRQFLLRGKAGVHIEVGLASVAHNLKKMKKCLLWWKKYAALKLYFYLQTA